MKQTRWLMADKHKELMRKKGVHMKFKGYISKDHPSVKKIYPEPGQCVCNKGSTMYWRIKK